MKDELLVIYKQQNHHGRLEQMIGGLLQAK